MRPAGKARFFENFGCQKGASKRGPEAQKQKNVVLVFRAVAFRDLVFFLEGRFCF